MQVLKARAGQKVMNYLDYPLVLRRLRLTRSCFFSAAPATGFRAVQAPRRNRCGARSLHTRRLRRIGTVAAHILGARHAGRRASSSGGWGSARRSLRVAQRGKAEEGRQEDGRFHILNKETGETYAESLREFHNGQC